ncbi:MAG: DinB family protein [Chloroflexota bacterium]|nr:DinB family protein [Chloroflexota bacterium]
MTATLPELEAGRPWPLHVVEHDAGPESGWGPTEVLAHVAEMLPYWLGEIERVLEESPEPVPFGRTVADRMRVLAIERDRSLPPRELLDRIGAVAERYARRIAAMGPGDLARRGLHPTLGELTVAEILERFVIGHAEGHVVQLDEALGSATGAS